MAKYPYAFECWDDNEKLGNIEFGWSKEALYALDLYSEVTRKPQYDEYCVLGYVPSSRLLSDGWSWTCGICDRFLYEEDDPVCIGNNAYCPDGCAEHYKDKIRLARIRRGQIKAFLVCLFPNLESLHISLHGIPHASFRLRGVKEKVIWSSKTPDYVSCKDISAVEEYIKRRNKS